MILRVVKNPLFWFALLMAVLTVRNNFHEGEPQRIIRSDGRGYYAYLPSMFIYNDPTFESSVMTESNYYEDNFTQYYLFKTVEGHTYNKYSPGIAILQTPFFLIGATAAYFMGYPVDGYSPPFEVLFMIGSLFYSIIGIILFSSFLRQLLPGKERVLHWFVPAFYVSTSLLFYNTNTLGFTHHYTFFLFGAFTWLLMKLKNDLTPKYLVVSGVVLGLITLVRPTNILVILILPFILGSKENTIAFFKELFSNKFKPFLRGTLGFLTMVLILFSIWKWQSGNWIMWSYNGEGFNFFSPALFENLFGFRIGLLLQNPIVILAIFGGILLVKKDRFLGQWWWIYCFVNAWVISSWWCWDYESIYGNRPFTEHLFFLLIPIIFLLEKLPKLTIGFAIFFSLIGSIRYETFFSGFTPDQQFTAQNYIPSLFFWNESNHGRWSTPDSVPPFGEMVQESVLVEEDNEISVGKNDLFIVSGSIDLPNSRTHERFYFKANMEKKCEKPLVDVLLVVHAFNADQSKNYYYPMPLYNDQKEGLRSWDEIHFSGIVPDNFREYETIKIYIWNKGQESFKLRNVKTSIETYKS